MKKASLHLTAIVVALALFLAVLLFSSADAIVDNATTVADDLLGADEFLMESETARRILLTPPTRRTSFTYAPTEVFCKGTSYQGKGGCDPRLNPDRKENHCTYIQHCRDAGH